MIDKKKFRELMAAAAEVFERELSEPLLEIYWKVLEPFTDEQATNALNKCLVSCRFFPKPADLLESLQGKEEDRATQAWELVDKTMRQVGNYQSINFGDPKIHRAIEMLGGWPYLGTLTEDEWKWKRKEFESAYRAIQGHSGPPQVQGLIEQSNSPLGYEVPAPIQIASNHHKLLQ